MLAFKYDITLAMQGQLFRNIRNLYIQHVFIIAAVVKGQAFYFFDRKI